MNSILKKALAAGSFFLLTVPEHALCADPEVSVSVTVNGKKAGICQVYVSKTGHDGSPPSVPAPSDGDVMITQGFDYKLIINCTKRESLDDAVRILQTLTGAR